MVGYNEPMEPVVHTCETFEEADDWDVRQQLAMTPMERIRAARELQRRAWPDAKDVRECEREIQARR